MGIHSYRVHGRCSVHVHETTQALTKSMHLHGNETNTISHTLAARMHGLHGDALPSQVHDCRGVYIIHW